MRPSPFITSCALLLSSACASGLGSTQSAADRVILSDNGSPVKQSVNNDTRATFNAPRAKVWAALVGSYTALGIAPTVTDEAGGVYGNRGFVFPAHVRDRPVEDYFYCGSGISGLGSSGRLFAHVESSLAAQSDTEVVVVTQVTGRFRSNAGTSNNAIDCSSRGAIEQFIQIDIKRRLAMTP